MKPAPFVYHAPASVDEALALLARGDDARVLAGGQSLVPLLKLRILKPAALIDVNDLSELAGIESNGDGLRIGALTRQQALVESNDARAAQPLLHAAGRHAGYLATRHRGTVGGSLAYAAPWAELAGATVALDATIELRSTRGSRTVPAREFFVEAHETVLEPDELLTAVTIPPAAPRTGVGFHEVSARYRDYADVAAAATVTVDDDGSCSVAELVLLRVAATPHRVDVSSLHGTRLEDEALQEVASSLDDLDPPSDIEASGTFRLRVARSLAQRALRDAYHDATGTT